MATIATTTNTTPFIYPSTTLLARDPTTGYLYCMIKASTADNYTIYRSTNGGTSWASFLNLVRTNVTEIGSIFVHSEGWLYWCYRTNESSQDRIYFRRASLAGTGSWQGEVQLAAVANGGVAGAIYAGVDLTVVRTPSAGHFICVVAATNSGSTHGVTAFGVTISPTTGIPVLNNGIIVGNRLWLFTGSGRITPSIDLEHIGNGEGAGSPNAWIAFGRDKLVMVKMAWNGAGWAGPSSVVAIASSITATNSIAARWDGSRWLMAIQSPTNTSAVAVYERNQANSTTIVRTTGTHPTGVIRNCTLAYSATSGDIRVYAVGTSTTVLYYADFIRATGLWSAWTSVLATAVLGATGDNFGARRNSYGDARYSVYTAHTGSSTIHTLQTLAYAPNTPTWTTAGLPYVDGGAADVALPLTLDWIFTDPDINDTQGWFAVSRQIGAGALNYWRASDSTWQVAEVQNAGSSTTLTLAAAWGTDGTAAHAYKVKVWDSAGTASAYSAALTVLPSARVDPVITAPAAAAVLVADSVTATWTAAEQTAYRVSLDTNPGTALNSNPYFETNATNWSPSGGTFARSTAQFHQGVASGLLTPNGVATTVEVGSEQVVADPGTSYRASAWVRCAAARNVNIGFNFYDAAGTFIGDAIQTVAVPLTTWTLLDLTATPISGTGLIQIKVQMTGTPPAGHLLYIDEARIHGPLTSDSGWIADSVTRSYTPAYRLPDVTAWTLKLSTRNLDGLASTEQTVSFTVDFVEPAVPTLVCTPVPAAGWIAVAITNPTPGGGQPVLSYNDLYRRVASVGGEGIRVASGLASGATYNDWRASSGTAYEYRALAFGANGTSIYSAWTG